jgi:hypothetical protein
MSQPQLIDLSHTVEDGLITYKGLPAPIICDYLSREASRKVYAEGTEFQIGKIEMVSNTGTYLETRRFIAMRMAKTSPICRWNNSPISTGCSSTFRKAADAS